MNINRGGGRGDWRHVHPDGALCVRSWRTEHPTQGCCPSVALTLQVDLNQSVLLLEMGGVMLGVLWGEQPPKVGSHMGTYVPLLLIHSIQLMSFLLFSH